VCLPLAEHAASVRLKILKAKAEAAQQLLAVPHLLPLYESG
jgi:hypothetical protein